MNPLVEHIIAELHDFYPEYELRELALWVVEEATGQSRFDILTDCKGTQNIPDIEIILHKLRLHEPVQYVFEHAMWMGLDLRVTPATLIPRPETAELVEWVLQRFDMPKSSISSEEMRLLDIGTGSGCIALAVKRHRPQWQVTGIDCSGDALRVAQENAVRNHLLVNWLQKDIFTDEIGSFDIIVSNPPYVCEHEKADMSARVLNYEPASALFVPDEDPLRYYRTIATLKKSRHLFFEINEAYGDDVCRLLNESGYTDIELKHDMYGKSRMVYGRIAE